MQSGPVQQGGSAYSGETDADLLVYMSMGKDDLAASKSAWEEFYSRHARYLYAVSLRAYGALLGGEAGVCDLVADTFRRAYEHAGHFRRRRRDGSRAAASAHSGMVGPDRTATGAEHVARSEQDADALPRSGRMAERSPGANREPAEDMAQTERVREALMALSERERLVLRVTLQWYRPGEEHQRLPNDVAADLARTLQTTPENLRQIRRRAMRKVAARLTEARQNAPQGDAK